MAHKRMFSKDITGSDAFREMPPSSQALYFHLGMEADDDGFLDNYKGIMRSVNASEDDLRILVTKRFLIVFPSKVVVVKHWLINNTIRKDRYTKTKYLDEKAGLIVKENGAYTELPGTDKRLATKRQPPGNPEEDRIEEDSKGKKNRAPREGFDPLGAEVIKAFETVDPKNKGYYGNTTQRAACDFLIAEYGLDEVLKRISVLSKTNKVPYFPSITTPHQLKEKWVQLADKVAQKRNEVAEVQAKKGKVI